MSFGVASYFLPSYKKKTERQMINVIIFIQYRDDVQNLSFIIWKVEILLLPLQHVVKQVKKIQFYCII